MSAAVVGPMLPAVLAAIAVLVWPVGQSRPAFVADPRAAQPGGGGAALTRWRWGRRGDELSVPDVLDLLALALQAGASAVGALRATSERLPGPAGVELRAVAAALEWGLPEAAAWSAAPERWESAGRALRLAARAGVPPAELLRRAAEDARRERLGRVEAATARLGVRLVLPLGLAFLPAFVLTTVVPVVLALAGSLLSGGVLAVP